MKRKVLACGLILVLTAGMTAGCGKKEVDYSIDKKSSEQSSVSGDNSLTEFKDAEKWSDEWTIVDENGRSRTLVVDAEVIVPDVDNMSVVEVKRAQMDAGFRERFLQSFFEKGDIYYYDEAHWPKNEIYKRIAELEEESEQWDDETNAQIEEAIEDLAGFLPEASEDYTAAEDFTSCNTFAGYRGDVLCVVHFWGQETVADTGDTIGNFISAGAAEQEESAPKSLAEYDEVGYCGVTEGSQSDESLNECKYTKEDARNIADSYLKAIGISNGILIEEGQSEWIGRKYNGDGSVADEKSVNYGYSFSYGIGIDGMAFLQYLHYARVDTEWDDEAKPGDFFDGESITIRVTDEGVDEVLWKDPVEIRNISDSVELLPLDTIKNIFANEAVEHAERYDFRNNMAFNRLELNYIAIKDNSDEGVFAYVPVWRLERSDNAYPILVNAVDGSVLYILKTPLPADME